MTTHQKDLNVGDFLIDYRPQRGADRFACELTLFGSDEIPHWPSVAEHLRVRNQTQDVS